jgi:hypothetical protein
VKVNLSPKFCLRVTNRVASVNTNDEDAIWNDLGVCQKMVKKKVLMFALLLFADVALGETRFVIATVGNLRDQPDTAAKIVGKLPIATAVNVVEERDKWVRVVVEEDEERQKSGWLAGEFLGKERPTMETLRRAYDAAPRYGDGSYFERMKWVERLRALDWKIAESLRQKGGNRDRGGQLFPFTDFNSIKPGGVYRAGTEVVFLTAGGLKSVDRSTLQWKYVASPNILFSLERPSGPLWDEPLFFDVPVPDWYKKPTYLSIVYADSKTHPEWMLTSNANEGAVCDGQDILDLKEKRLYSLPCEGFNAMLVDDRTAWLGSRYGVTKINLDTAERTDFVTIPPVTGIAGAVPQGQKVFYGTNYGGAFTIDKTDGTIRSIEKINSEVRKGFRLEDLAIQGRIIYFLLSPIDKTGWYKQTTTRLAVFDTDTLDVTVLDTGISVATTLIVARDKVYGYGAKEEWIEGGQRIGFYGGAFEYSIPNRKCRKLIDKPVSYFSISHKQGLLIDSGLGGGRDVYHSLAGKHVDYKSLAVTQYIETKPDSQFSDLKLDEMIFDVGGKLMRAVPAGRTSDRYPAPTYEFADFDAGDPRMSVVQLIEEMRAFERSRKNDRERQLKETFSGLQIRPTTGSTRIGQIADWRSN